MAIIESFELINYIGSGSRPFEEGSRVLNSNHILMCGLCNSKQKGIDEYFALCLSSTSQTNYPHEISIKIAKNNETKLLNALCSCQAGKSGKYKHIVGVLLYLNRKTKESIEELGCTDLRQQWGQIKQKVSDAYVAEEFNKFCHGQQVECSNPKTAAVKKEIFRILCEADTESELGQTKNMRRSAEYIPEKVPTISKRVLKSLDDNVKYSSKKPKLICNLNQIFGFNKNVPDHVVQQIHDFLINNIWPIYSTDFNMKISSKEQAEYFNKYVKVSFEQAKEIILSTVKQNSTLWLEERKKRIIGSICYSLYTYSKNAHTENEWEKKLTSLYKSSFTGNKHTIRGKENEEKARRAYETLSGNQVQEFGLLILPTSSWFGYSVDGIANNNILIELKCPKNDSKVKADQLLKSLPYINIINDEPVLVTNHQYYGQVQMGMGLYGLQNSHFVIFEDVFQTCSIVSVPRNDEFIKLLFRTLSHCYLQRILPWLTLSGTENVNI